jgi:tetratricopeptide (TPR) repeat protein
MKPAAGSALALRAALFSASSLLAGCAGTESLDVPLFSNLGSHHREVTTRSSEAQRYFDQGWIFYQAFNHGEARRAFARAAEIDPTCAMAQWGVALAHGPHINNMEMTEDQSRAAHAAVTKAQELAGGASEVEKALITALAARYPWPIPEDRRVLDEAYARAMREVHARFPDDPDAAVLFAESLMNLRPWDLWSPEGEPRPETPEILAVLEKVMAAHPSHPLANHAYIHAVEASPHPEKALAAADRLRDLVPGAAHLVHMPSHIDIRLGRYAKAVAANERAIAADRRYLAVVPRTGFYSMYRAHNHHFLVYAAMFLGQSRLALSEARALWKALPREEVLALPDILEGFLATPYHVLVRFGRWRDILDAPAPDPAYKVTSAAWRYARGLALSSLGRLEDAAREEEAFLHALDEVPESAYIGNNPARVVLEVGRAMLAGELEYRRGHHERAFQLLREAVRRDVALHYDEPWGWMQPAAHALGALLLEQGRLDEAEAVYRDDLARHPGNGWSLHGLAECLERRGAVEEAARAQEAFRAAWAAADVTLRGSCFCRTS